VLVEGDGIWTRLEVDFKTPSEMLFVVLRGNHQVISAWWDAGREPFFTSDDWVRLTQIWENGAPGETRSEETGNGTLRQNGVSGLRF
jgi:hypothetical protein